MWAVIILLISNIGLAGILWTKATKKSSLNSQRYKTENRQKPMKDYLANELKLSKTQIEQYIDLKKQHFNNIGPLRDSMQLIKSKVHDELFRKNPDSLYIHRMADSIGKMNARFEQMNFMHFMSLKEVLNDEQAIKLKELMNHHSVTGEHKRRHRHRKGRN